jgi:predicted acyl esterase
MAIERDAAVPMDDGTILRADVFLPLEGGPWPAIMSLGPYGKGIPFCEGVFAERYERLVEERPEVLEGSSGAEMCWETVDPEQWIPAGYAVVRVDSRGAGRSPGVLDLFSPREVRDYRIAIEWAAAQPWCTGRIGLAGVSYYAINQWLVAATRPPHLSAIVPWEGASDHYRDMTHHGGILSNNFFANWYPRQVLSAQHGLGREGPPSPWVPDGLAAGPETLSAGGLAASRADYLADIGRHRFDDEWHRARSADLARIEVPVLSAANWGGLGLHSRGNFEGFVSAGSADKWLDVHTGRHEEEFYTPEGRELQRAFFDRHLRGIDNGWEDRARVTYVLRHADRTLTRATATAWPLEETTWERWHLESPGILRGPLEGPPGTGNVAIAPARAAQGATFLSRPLESRVVLVGPVAARLYARSPATDADVFCTLRAYDVDGREVDFAGANDPHAPLSQGWLRLSHRSLDPARTKPWRPWHPHDKAEPLRPGTAHEAEVELWPTCVELPPGSRLALTVGCADFARPGAPDPTGHPRFSGSGPFLHDDSTDRRMTLTSPVLLLTGRRTPSSLLLPVVGGSTSPR